MEAVKDKTCAQCVHLEEFLRKIPEHITFQSFRWCVEIKEGRFPMQGACESYSGKDDQE